MATEIKMPQLSDTMHSGKILTWKKSEGDQISRGDILAEVETDKANLEIESFWQGVLLKINVPAGEMADVGETIGYIGAPGEEVKSNGTGGSKSEGSVANGKESDVGMRHPADGAGRAKITTEDRSPIAPTEIEVSGEQAIRSSSDRVKASPLARKIASERNIDIGAVSGTGPGGRIIKRDIEAASSNGKTAHAAASNVRSADPMVTERQPASQPVNGGRMIPLSKMRETIARRMQESVTQSPHFYVTTSINMTEAKRLREELKDTPGYEGISFNHLVIKAAAYALANEPRVNRSMRDGMMFEPDNINIGIITAIEDGLMIPVLHQADKLSLKDVVFEARAAVERTRAGRPTALDLSGGTFSISNMGMFDVDSFTAIINPGQGGVLAISAIKEEPIISNGAIVIGYTMKATVSVDHRVIDGVMAGNFLKYFKKALEIPALLMM